MLKPVYLRQFEKDLTRAIKRNKDIGKLKQVIEIIGSLLKLHNRCWNIFELHRFYCILTL